MWALNEKGCAIEQNAHPFSYFLYSHRLHQHVLLKTEILLYQALSFKHFTQLPDLLRSRRAYRRVSMASSHFQLIKGNDSDLKNTSGLPLASSVVGGMFL
jgi:hypothetical protein